MEIIAINLSQITTLINTYFESQIDYNETAKFFGEELPKSQKLSKTIKQKYIEKIANNIYDTLLKDAAYIQQKDPSLKTIEEVFNTKTKSLIATMLYRVANFFYYNTVGTDQNQLRLIARQLTEEGLSNTSIDIHPAAVIGEGFFIDHGANVVIGETTVIGKNCNLFNNVILGSKNVVSPMKESKRHPTLKDNVTICAGAKILGNITIGNNVFVSPSAVVLEDIEDDNKVIITNQVQVTKNDKYAKLPSQKLVIYGMMPKFKNTLVIFGEGFYNPTVLIKLKTAKDLNYTITYWDKNKIIVKIKNTTPLDEASARGAKVIILSNANKVVVLQSIGLERALTTLSD